MMRIVSYRRGRKTQRTNQAILKVSDINDREAARKLLGKRVTLAFSKTSINGVVTRVHGDNGRVVVRFHRGIPGQSLTKFVVDTSSLLSNHKSAVSTASKSTVKEVKASKS